MLKLLGTLLQLLELSGLAYGVSVADSLDVWLNIKLKNSRRLVVDLPPEVDVSPIPTNLEAVGKVQGGIDSAGGPNIPVDEYDPDVQCIEWCGKAE